VPGAARLGASSPRRAAFGSPSRLPFRRSAHGTGGRELVTAFYEPPQGPRAMGVFRSPPSFCPPLRARAACSVRGRDRTFCALVRRTALVPPLGSGTLGYCVLADPRLMVSLNSSI
jgi:hypothetical protein